MANMNFDDYAPKKATKFGDRPKIGYFNSLKDDGDEALVRLNYDTKSDFKVVTVHRVSVDGKWRNVSCLKEAYDTDEKCPLCASGNKMLTKVFVSLLDYVKDESGKVVAEPKVWERPYSVISDILDAFKDAVDDGFITPTTNIRDVVLKIRRVGEKGSISTKYKIKVLNPAVSPETTYVKDFSAFKDFDAAHHSYSIKTAEEMTMFLETGNFPAKEKKDVQEPKQESAPAVAEAKEEPAPAPRAEVTAEEPAPATNKPKRYAF